jgi:peroxiredoxin Q/BCP
VLEQGAEAPDFTLASDAGEQVTLSQFRGRPVVLYFYPRDDTPGCTAEACQFNDNLHAFQTAQVPVVGVSPDDAASHQRFRNKFGLRFTLLSDPDHAVADQYGAWGERNRYGRTIVGILRSTFLIDEEGKVERAWYNVKADGHAAKVLEELAG